MKLNRQIFTKLSATLPLALISIMSNGAVNVAIAEQSLVVDKTENSALIPAKEDTVLAYSGTSSSIKPISREKAIQLAEQHLTLRNNRWGRPVDVRDTADQYVVVFKTPDIESRIIGQRSVSVDKDSGLVQILERR